MKRVRRRTQAGKQQHGAQDVGPDGYPTDPRHPFNRTIADPVRKHISREMWKYERAWRDGSLHAASDAVAFCHEKNIAPPAWLVIAVETLVARQLLAGSGRVGVKSRQVIFNENQRHFIRWDLMRELLEQGRELYGQLKDDSGLNMEKARAAVAKKLKKMGIKGGEDAIKYSYELVERRLAEGGGGEFYMPRFKPRLKQPG